MRYWRQRARARASLPPPSLFGVVAPHFFHSGVRERVTRLRLLPSVASFLAAVWPPPWLVRAMSSPQQLYTSLMDGRSAALTTSRTRCGEPAKWRR